MTEQQARTKWCPMTRLGADGETANRHMDDGDVASNPVYARCIGSACMMWQWDEKPFKDPNRDIDTSGSGHCGLVRGAAV